MSKEKQKQGNIQRAGEGQMYDKLMRENLLELFLPLVAEELNFKVKKVTPLVDKQPTTIIRETDGFLLIETDAEEEPKFILHLEFESKDDLEMVYRISEHHGIELRKYRLPIKHVVVYLGERMPKMRTKLQAEEIFEGFQLVNARQFSPEKWLGEHHPSRVIMAVLGDYQKQDAPTIIEAILVKLRQVCETTTDLKKYISHLTFLSRMRNLEQLTIQISEAMPISMDVESSYLYQLGLKKAEELLLQATTAAEAAKNMATKAKESATKAKKSAVEAKEIALKEAAKVAKLKQEKAKLEAEAKIAAKIAAKIEAKKIKKISIQKMQLTNRFSDEEIADFLDLDMKTLKEYVKEIKQEQEVSKK